MRDCNSIAKTMGVFNENAMDAMIKSSNAKARVVFRRKPYESIAECQKRLTNEIFQSKEQEKYDREEMRNDR